MDLQKMRKINQRLRELGFLEVRNKRFLFRKNLSFEHEEEEHIIIFFADMRAKVNPFQDLPFCYAWDPNETAPYWIRQRIEREQCELLESEGISTGIEDEEYLDGFCKGCGLDFRDDDYYCPECIKKQELERIEEAKRLYDEISDICICGVKLTCNGSLLNEIVEYGIGPIRELIPHHTSYDPEITMPVCRSCHTRIELTDNPEFAKYRAKDKRPKKVRKTIDRRCVTCGNKLRIKREEFIPEKEYECPRCRKKTKRHKQAKTRSKIMTWHERRALEAKFGDRYKGTQKFDY